jgi:hypothetical protein
MQNAECRIEKENLARTLSQFCILNSAFCILFFPQSGAVMTVLSLRLYAAVVFLLGAVQVVYNALWIGAPSPPFEISDYLIALELGWTLVSIDMAVRMRRRRLPAALPVSYVLYTAATLGYSAWLATSGGIGGITDAMVPLWWKLGAVAVGAWYVAGAVFLVAKAKEADAQG